MRWLLLFPPMLPMILAGCESRWSAVDTAGGAKSAAPEVYLTSPAVGSTWQSNVALPVEAVVSDDVDAPADLTILIVSDLDGTVATPILDGSGLLEATVLLAEGTHNLQVIAIDSDGNEGAVDTTIRVLGTHLSQPVPGIEPSAPVTGTPLVASLVAESTSPEGGELTYTWGWTVDGVDAGVSDEVVPPESVERGQTWQVSVVATDGEFFSPAGTRSVTIGNAPPNPGLVWISPENPGLGVDLTCVTDEVVDAEADAFSLATRWIVNGVDAGIVGQVLPGADLHRGDVVQCIVTTDDGEVTAWPSAEERVGNGAPTAGSVRVTPSIATESTTLTCVGADVSDPDGDPVALGYRWFVNSVEAGAGASLNGAAFNHFDGVVCEVTPADPWSVGSAVLSDALIIDNTPPGAPTVSLDRSTAVTGETVTCTVTAEATDVDDDAIAYRWEWAVDGAIQSESSAIFDTTGYADDGSVMCTATANDGTSDGGSGSDTLTLIGPTSGTLSAAAASTTIIVSTLASAALGKAVDGVDDLDGDGLRELLASAPGDGGGNGAVYLFASGTLAGGGSVNTTAAIASWKGAASGDNLGGTRGVSGAGDMDADALGDVLVSSPLEDTGGKDAGTAYLLYGGGAWGIGNPVDDEADARFSGTTGGWFGARLASGDVNADGIDDIAISAPYHDACCDKAGAVAVYYGGARWVGGYDTSDADALILGDAEDVELGWSLGILGDGDADGYNDVAVGVFFDNPAGISDAGTAAFISGGELRTEEEYGRMAYLLVHGVAIGDRVGYDIASLGDVDGDGVDDMAIGEYLDDGVGTDSGAVALVYGRAGMNREIDFTGTDAMFFGVAAADQFGAVITPLGDFDADGLADFLIGAPTGSGGAKISAGATYAYLGRSSGVWGLTGNAADIVINGDTADDRAGDELCGRLDVTGDGYSDLAIGAQKADLGASGGGAVYIVEGP